MSITIDYTPEEASMFRAHAMAQNVKVEEFIRQFSVKALHNAEYLAMLDKSEQDLQEGSGVVKTMEELVHFKNDPKTYGGLFFALCEDVQDMELSEALRSLMSLFMKTVHGYGTEETEIIKSKVTNWIASQSRYIKGLFQNLCWES